MNAHECKHKHPMRTPLKQPNMCQPPSLLHVLWHSHGELGVTLQDRLLVLEVTVVLPKLLTLNVALRLLL